MSKPREFWILMPESVGRVGMSWVSSQPRFFKNEIHVREVTQVDEEERDLVEELYEVYKKYKLPKND